jgi:hypothetical protein
VLKFFQKIRQNLVKENKFSSYMLYAIGEIFLVVVGILIALQINNWNENRKLKASEVSTLKQLNIDLKSNLEEIEEIAGQMRQNNDAGYKLFQHIQDGLAVNDSVRAWTELFSSGNIFNNANTTYSHLQTSDRVVISNDSLRLRITLMYERDFANIHRRELMEFEQYIRNYKEELVRSFKPGPVQRKWLDNVSLRVNTPVDITSLRTDEAYANVHIELYNFRLVRIKWITESIEELKVLIEDIESEIRELEES